MAEESKGQEKTEEATPRKLQKAREDGQLARSRELNTVAVVFVGALALMAIGPMVSTRIMGFATASFEQAASGMPMAEYLAGATSTLLIAVLPFCLFLAVAAVASSVVVGGFVFSTKALAFKADRISPLKGMKRIFSRKSFVELLKAIGKFLLISSVASAALYMVTDQLLVLGDKDILVGVGEGVTVVLWCLLAMGFVLFVIAAIDVPFQISDFQRQMKMTKQEVKDEMKDSEGKPEVKSRVRQMQQQISQRRMLSDIPDADVVITNPEHYAVALKYDEQSGRPPIVIAKGADLMAMQIRKIAAAHDVPQVATPPLTRAIYYAVEIGGEIPGTLFVAVAQVLAYVFQLDAWHRGQGAEPTPLDDDMPIPEELRRDS
ncbi:MAG: flagellar biosynthesis protein FlhB [Pseudomonadaceae bacterium]|nr:flagellar biosynthesis protein FlhB [Pseudomonadaceae bacterium]